MSSTSRRRSRRTTTSTAALVVVLAVASCGSERAGSGSDDLPVLRIGSVGAASARGADLASGTPGADSAGAFTVRGALPTGPGSAPVHRYGKERAEETTVRTLAAAFGLDGAPTRHTYGWEVSGPAGVLHVRDGSGLEWTFSRSLEECAVYLVDIDRAGPSAISSCARAVSGGGSTGTPTPTDPVQVDATPAATTPAPSSAAALTAVAPILAVLGLDAEPRVLPAWSSWRTVLVDPRVAGLPTVGVSTMIDVEGTGVIGAMGRLATPVAGPAYPVLTATAALDRLNAAPRPMPAVDCPMVEGGSSSCPGGVPTPQVITGATLGLSLSFDGVDALLVPAWLYTVDGWTEPMPAVAVEDRYLGDPTPGSDPGAGSGGAGTDPSSGGSEPGGTEPDGTGATPIPPEEPAPGGSDPGAAAPGSAITAVAVTADGRRLVLTGWGGVCANYAGEATESGTEVRVSIIPTPTIGPDQACIELAKEIEVEVALGSPLGDRAVVDAATGTQLKVTPR